jgi:hypothetical protein
VSSSDKDNKMREAQSSTPDLEMLDGAWDEDPIGTPAPGYVLGSDPPGKPVPAATPSRPQLSRKEKDRRKAEELRAKKKAKAAAIQEKQKKKKPRSARKQDDEAGDDSSPASTGEIETQGEADDDPVVLPTKKGSLSRDWKQMGFIVAVIVLIAGGALYFMK